MKKKKDTGFFFEVDGEQIVDAQPHLDYAAHRGVEELIATKTPEESLHLVCRTCAGSPFSQQLCFAQGIEELARIEVPPRAKFIRTIVSELDRIYGHLLWLGVIGYEVGLKTVMDRVLRDQMLIMKLLETLLDFEEGHAINIIGGVRQDISSTPSAIEKISTGLGVIEDRLASYEELLLEEEKLSCRFEEVGVLEVEKARELCAVGPLARASGLQIDVRRDDAYAAFEAIDFNLVSSEYGNVIARILVILEETYESIHIVRSALQNLPRGEIRSPSPEWVEPGENLSRIETPQGETLHYLRLTSNKIDRLKIRPPAIANLASLLEMLTNSYIADIPVVIASVDPYFLGIDQIILKEITTERTHVYSRTDLRNYGIRWYKRKKQDG